MPTISIFPYVAGGHYSYYYIVPVNFSRIQILDFDHSNKMDLIGWPSHRRMDIEWVVFISCLAAPLCHTRIQDNMHEWTQIHTHHMCTQWYTPKTVTMAPVCLCFIMSCRHTHPPWPETTMIQYKALFFSSSLFPSHSLDESIINPYGTGGKVIHLFYDNVTHPHLICWLMEPGGLVELGGVDI